MSPPRPPGRPRLPGAGPNAPGQKPVIPGNASPYAPTTGTVPPLPGIRPSRQGRRFQNTGIHNVGFPNIGVMPQVSSILAGPSQMPAQRALNQQRERKELWPYTHIFPVPQAVRVEPEGILAAPLVATQSIVLAYQVPDGFQFAFTNIIQVYVGSGFTLGSTDVTWVLDVNTPIPAPAGGTGQGYPIQALSPSNIPKGAIAFSASGPQSLYDPWPLPMPEILGPLDILRSKVTTTAAITPGAPNYFITIFCGWMWESTL